MTCLLGIDIGTSGTKTLICDDTGQVLATAMAEHTVQSPKPGWSEQSPNQWWTATQKAVKAVVKKAKCKPADIKAIGLSGQMHGSVFVDEKNKPLRPALLWNDQRTSEQCEQIEQAVGGRKKLINAVGNPALTGFTAPKILWVRQHEPRVYDKTRRILLPKDYIRLCMTGEAASEVSDASGTLLLDVKKRQWNKTVLSKLEIDSDWMPPVYESHVPSAELSTAGAKALGLKVGTPVVGGGGDQAAGAVGNGVVATGIVSATLGTSGVVFAHADEPTYDTQGRVHTMCSAVEGKWCVFGCMLSAAGSLQWYRNTLAEAEQATAKKQKVDAYQLLDAQAEQAPAGCEGLFFLPYLTGERCPYPNLNARGGWIGLTARTDRSMMIRSLMEGVTFGMADQIQIMRQMNIAIKTVRLSGGGAKSPLWRQLQADIYRANVALTNSDEGPAYGVALLAGVGIGVWKNVSQACRAAISETARLKPNRKATKLYEAHHAQYTRLYHALIDEFDHIASL